MEEHPDHKEQKERRKAKEEVERIVKNLINASIMLVHEKSIPIEKRNKISDAIADAYSIYSKLNVLENPKYGYVSWFKRVKARVQDWFTNFVLKIFE